MFLDCARWFRKHAAFRNSGESLYPATRRRLLTGLEPLEDRSVPAALAFAPADEWGVVFPNGEDIGRVVTGDLNHDGRSDLVVLHAKENVVSVALGHVNGGFGVLGNIDIGIATGDGKPDVGLADFTGDGTLDLLVSNRAILAGNGDGTFGPPSFVNAPFNPHGVAVGDFDGDGTLDIAVSLVLSPNMNVMSGDAAGHFASFSGSPFDLAGAIPFAVTAAKCDGDATPDLLTADHGGNSMSALRCITGACTTFPGSPYAAGNNPISVATADVDGDGNIDAAVANQNGPGVTVFRGDGLGGFTPFPGSPLPFGGTPLVVAFADINRDGKLDVVSTDGSTLFVALGAGDGTFPAMWTLNVPADRFAVGDVDGDGATDVVVTSADTVTIYRNVTN